MHPTLLSKSVLPAQRLLVSHPHAAALSLTAVRNKFDIGTREIVGHGPNGFAAYVDRLDHPFPAIRFKEVTPDIAKLIEKEAGDWKNLSIDEKKQLYRYNYRQTFAEFLAPDGEWKKVFGVVFFLCGMVCWAALYVKIVGDPVIHDWSRSLHHQEVNLRKFIDMKYDLGRRNGICAKWDYEKDQWKS